MRLIYQRLRGCKANGSRKRIGLRDVTRLALPWSLPPTTRVIPPRGQRPGIGVAPLLRLPAFSTLRAHPIEMSHADYPCGEWLRGRLVLGTGRLAPQPQRAGTAIAVGRLLVSLHKTPRMPKPTADNNEHSARLRPAKMLVGTALSPG